MSDLALRFGGPMGEGEEEAPASVPSDAQKKAEERERKKAEVRKRLEESGKAGKKAKKGFLTPERKKKLRKILMLKAAEGLKQQQLLKEQERQKILTQRIVPLPNTDSTDDHAKLEAIYNELSQKLIVLEEERYDINQTVLAKDQEINELTIAVNDLRGKFVKPTLKKVSKYDNKFKKMAESGKKEEKADFRNNLKTVKKESAIAMITAQKKTEKPDWLKKEKDAKKEEKKEEAQAPQPEAEAAPADEPPASEAEASEAEEVSEAEE